MTNLAYKYRPKTLDEIVGQAHLLSKDSIFRALATKNRLTHTFLYGPPGCGKTTLARVIANISNRPFYEIDGTSLKIEEIRQIFKTHHNSFEKPIIFIDEIHRLSKNQQEVLLPYMEKHSGLIVGASTQNPYYSLTAALRSRSHVFELKSISSNEMTNHLNIVANKESIEIEDKAKKYLVSSSNGDIRAMLNLLESASILEETITITRLKEIRPNAMVQGSFESDTHYNLISAMIKSIRGSDIDASIYYLARLIDGGEPAEYIARRLAILASEDIGNANPPALNLANSTLNIAKEIGYPEARITLSQLVIYLASSPKSNSSYLAINSAINSINNGNIEHIPEHIKPNSNEYLYPHDHNGWIKQIYTFSNQTYYKSKYIGFEKTLDSWIKKIKFTKI